MYHNSGDNGRIAMHMYQRAVLPRANKHSKD